MGESDSVAETAPTILLREGLLALRTRPAGRPSAILSHL
jgi:hypothetical protein